MGTACSISSAKEPDRQKIECEERERYHARVFKTLQTVRKILRNTSRIMIGNRYALTLRTSDYENWPMISLDLVDRHEPERSLKSLIVRVSDGESPVISLAMSCGTILGVISLNEPSELAAIQKLLKKISREYLDAVSEIVTPPSDTSLKKPDQEGKPLSSSSSALRGIDLFDDQGSMGDNVLSVVKKVDVIPFDM